MKRSLSITGSKRYCVFQNALSWVSILFAAYVSAQSAVPPLEVFFTYPIQGVSSGGGTFFGGAALSSRAVALVDAAQSTIDLAAYNFDHAPLAAALRRAAARGVRVRVVTDQETEHPSLKNPVPNYFWIAVNEDGLMHHKFLVIDAQDSSRATVLMGSTNFTDANIFRFYNDMLLWRSPVLAKAYTEEMDMLWGSQGPVPNARESLSGSAKPRREITSFEIADVKGELYFSPNDEVSTRIAGLIDSALQEVSFQLLVLTQDDIVESLLNAHGRGVEVFGTIENSDDPSSAYPLLRNRGLDINRHVGDTVLHHKFGLIDPQLEGKQVLITGSHNWSFSAETFHDENTVVLKSAALSDLYRRASVQLHCLSGGPCRGQSSSAESVPLWTFELSPNPSAGILKISWQNEGVAPSAFAVVDQEGRYVSGGLLDRFSHPLRLDLSYLAAGHYRLLLRNEDGSWQNEPFLLTP